MDGHWNNRDVSIDKSGRVPEDVERDEPKRRLFGAVLCYFKIERTMARYYYIRVG